MSSAFLAFINIIYGLRFLAHFLKFNQEGPLRLFDQFFSGMEDVYNLMPRLVRPENAGSAN